MTGELRDVLARALFDWDEQRLECTPPTDTLLAALRSDPATIAVFAKALRDEGLDDVANQSYHDWRCTYPDRYEPCDHFDQLVSDLLTRLLGAPHG